MQKIKLLITAFFVLAISFTAAQAQCTTAVSSINENFDAIANGARPACWNGVTGAPGSNALYVNSKMFYMLRDPNSTLASPLRFITVMPLCSVKGTLKFDLGKLPNGLPAVQLEVGTMTDPNDAGTFVTFKSLSSFQSTAVTQTVDLSSYTGPNAHIAFRTILLKGEGFTFDNVTWSPAVLLAPVKAPMHKLERTKIGG